MKILSKIEDPKDPVNKEYVDTTIGEELQKVKPEYISNAEIDEIMSQ